MGLQTHRILAASYILRPSYYRITLLLKFCPKIDLAHYLWLRNKFCHSVERTRLMRTHQNHESYFLSPVNEESTNIALSW